MVSISGALKSVVFANEENDYRIVRLKTKKSVAPEGIATLVGEMPDIAPGEEISAEGQWDEHEKHGRQFLVKSILVTEPKTLANLADFLASGAIRGIGKKYATELLQRFGAQIFDIIEKESKRLEEVAGIGKARRQQIRESWFEHKSKREIISLCVRKGVSATLAMRIYRHYGEDAGRVLRKEPYIIAREIRGIGFHTADQLAQKMGLAINSAQRAQAGIFHCLREARKRGGHNALPYEVLLEESVILLEIEEDLVEQQILKLVEEGKFLCKEESEGKTLIFLKFAREQEKQAARVINKLAASPVPKTQIKYEEELDQTEDLLDFKLSAQQRDAARKALSSNLLVISGGPGVGKTTILCCVNLILAKHGVDVRFCAPTGRAAKRMSESLKQVSSQSIDKEAVTIHRILEANAFGNFGRDEDNPMEGDVFVIDEASMLDISLASKFLRAMPVGGRLILVGDIDQLPPVGAGAPLRDIILSGLAGVCRLDRIYRQSSGSDIISAAHAFNNGNLPEFLRNTEAESNSDFFFVKRQDSVGVTSAILKLVSKRIPRKFGFDPINDIQVLAPMNRGELGVWSLNEMLREALNPSKGQSEVKTSGASLRVGDKVIQTKNNYEKNIFNGDIGRVMSYEQEKDELRVDFSCGEKDGKIVVFKKNEKEQLTLAYAISIHKSQGSEFPAVVIPISFKNYIMLRRNLVYTAVTRGKRLVILVGEMRALQFAISKRVDDERFGALLQDLRKN